MIVHPRGSEGEHALDSRDPTRTTHLGPSRSTRGLWAIGAALILVVVVACVLDLRAQRQVAIDDTRRSLAQLGRVLAEDTARYARSVDIVLRNVQSRITDLGITTPAQFGSDLADRAMHDFLRAREEELPQGSVLSLVDASGRMVNSSRGWPSPQINVSDRDYFRHVAAHKDPAPYVTEIQHGRVTGLPTLFLVRRISGPNGAFLGVVAGVMDIGHLTARYEAIQSQTGESITLLRRDGRVLARYPQLDAAIGKQMPPDSPWYAAVAAGGGTYLSPGYLAHRPSIVAANPVRDYDLVVDVVVATDTALAAWRRQAITTALAALAIAIGIVVLFAVIARQFRRLRLAAEALQASERRTRDYASTASEWFWDQDADLRFTWISQDSPIRRPFDSSYIGQTRQQLVGFDPNDPHWEAHLADLAARRPFRDFVYQRIGNDGQLHHMSISGKPVFDEAGRFTGYRGTGRDITAAVEAAEELRRAKDLAETASRVKSEFLASMTHELRTPLNAIIGFAELIRDQPFGAVGAHYAEYAREIHASGHHLLAVINDVLDMSKIEAGRYELSDEIIDLRGKVASVCATLAPRAAECQVRLQRDASVDGAAVRADRRAVRQVLLNVLSNAVKFTPAGGNITVRAELAADGTLALVVTDTGIGIDPAALRALFEPFQQADSSITRRFGGTGLGLAISRRLMTLHGGALELDSTPGKGTTVRVIFPRERVVAVPSTGTAGVVR